MTETAGTVRMVGADMGNPLINKFSNALTTHLQRETEGVNVLVSASGRAKHENVLCEIENNV